MYCKHCGSEINDNSKFCPNCGVELQNDEVRPESSESANDDQETNKVSPFGVVSFVLSIIMAVICPAGFIPSTKVMFLLAIPSVVFGIVGVSDSKHKKHGLAIAGLVICTIAILTGGLFRIGK